MEKTMVKRPKIERCWAKFFKFWGIFGVLRGIQNPQTHWWGRHAVREASNGGGGLQIGCWNTDSLRFSHSRFDLQLPKTCFYGLIRRHLRVNSVFWDANVYFGFIRRRIKCELTIQHRYLGLKQNRFFEMHNDLIGNLPNLVTLQKIKNGEQCSSKVWMPFFHHESVLPQSQWLV